MNDSNLAAGTRFDRVVSVEMFEHMRNYEPLLARIGVVDGTRRHAVRAHLHPSRASPIRSKTRDESDWMARYFFTGGIMPSDDLLLYFQRDLRLLRSLAGAGQALPAHQRRPGFRTWTGNRAEIDADAGDTYGAAQASRWWVYWRVFFMACAELWGYAGGREWLVSHYLFEKR